MFRMLLIALLTMVPAGPGGAEERVEGGRGEQGWKGRRGACVDVVDDCQRSFLDSFDCC